MEPAGGSPEQFAARIRNDLDAMAKVIRDAGLRMN
jgi:tripartite-type tricarboxylate transporter receptor subunit TctC